MNRSYKVIWNKSLRCFMAVSEYAKSRGKSSSSSVSSNSVASEALSSGAKLLRLTAICAGIAASGFSMQAIAADGNFDNINATGDIVAAGNVTAQNITALDGRVGQNETDITALDGRVGQNETDISALDGRVGQNATDIGTNTTNISTNTSSIADHEARITNNTTKITTNINSITDILGKLGVDTDNPTTGAGVKYFRANSSLPDAEAAGEDSVAIGPNAKSEGESSLVAGNGAATTEGAQGAIALGQGAQAGTVSIDPNFVDGEGSIAIGRNTVTGGTSSTAVGDGAKATASNSAAMGNNAQATGSSATALGANANASGEKGIALGEGATAAAKNNISIGESAGVGTNPVLAGDQANNIAIGAQSGKNVKGQFNVALGESAGSNVTGNENIAFGRNSGAKLTGEQNISIGLNANNKGKTANRAVAIGDDTVADTQGVAIGSKAVAGSNGVALGHTAKTTGTGVALGQQSYADSNYVALGLNSRATQGDVVDVDGKQINSAFTNRSFSGSAVSVGSSEAGNSFTRRIVNVEDGANDTDAVNVRQLSQAISGIDLSDINFADGVIKGLQDQIDNNLLEYVSVNDDGQDKGNKNNNGASAANSVAIGPDAATQGVNSTAIGYKAGTEGESAVALGHNIKGIGKNSTTIGNSQSEARGESAIAIGTNVESRDENSIVIGRDSEADRQENGPSVKNSIVIGTSSQSTAVEGIVIGKGSLVNAPRGIAQGSAAKATASDAMAFGTNSVASGVNSQASGIDATASGENASASGTKSNASGTRSIASGKDSNSYATDGLAIGTDAVSGISNPTTAQQASNANTIAIGKAANATDLDALAMGNNAQASKQNATAIGSNAKATANYAQAFGENSQASGVESIAQGRNAIASAEKALAIGSAAKATEASASAFGSGANAAAENASAFGVGATAQNRNSVAIGAGAQAQSNRSVALGDGAVAGGATGTSNAEVNGLTYGDFAGTNPVATVSVGTATEKRTITNVAAGRISSASTDAINGSQLYITNNVLGNVANTTKNILGGNAALASDGRLSMSKVGGTNFDTVDGAIKYAAQGWNVQTNGEEDTNVAPGEKVNFVDGKNIKITNDGKKVTVATADDVNFNTVNVDKTVTIGGDTANQTVINKGKVTTNNLTVKGETKLGDNFTVNNDNSVTYNGKEIANKGDGLSFKGNTGGIIAKTLGDGQPLTISGALAAGEASSGANLRVDSDGNNLNLVMAKDLTDLDSATFGKGNNQFTINQGGVQFVNKDGDKRDNTPSITAGGIDGGNQQITGVQSGLAGTSLEGAKGDTLLNAVNVGDLQNNITGVVNKGFNIAADNSGFADGKKIDNVKLGETVRYTSSDGNIITTIKDNEIDFGLGKDLSVGDYENPGTIVVKGENGKDGVTINGADGSIGLTGADGANGIISVTNGVAGVDGKDGITRIVVDDVEVATMKDGLKFAGNTGDTIGKQLNETLTVKGELADNANASGANLRVDSKDGHLNLVMARELTDLDSATFGKAGNRFTINQAGVQFVDATGDKRANTPSITTGGIDGGNNQITSVESGLSGATLEGATGDTLTNAVNVGDLKNNITGVIDKGFNITADNSELADNATEDNVKLGETVSYTSSDGNIITTVKDNKIDFGLGNDLSVGDDDNPGTIIVKGENGKDGVTINGKDGTIGLNGKDGANGTISVKNGVPSVDGQDSITRIVVDDVEVATMKDGLKFAGNTGDTIDKQLNGTLTVKGELADDATASGANLRVDSQDGNLNLVMARELTDLDSATFGKAGNRFTINQAGVQFVDAAGDKRDNTPSITAGGIDMGGNKITKVAAGTKDDDAVNFGQLNKVSGDVSKGLNFTGDDTTTVINRQLGQTLNITGGATGGLTNGNIGVVANGNQLEVKMAENIDLGNNGSITMGDTVVNNDGLTIAGGPSVTKDGIDAGGNKITGVAKGDIAKDSTDAVNGSQLWEVKNDIDKDVAASKTEVTEGKNITVTETKGADGQTIYEVATSDEVAFDKVDVGSVSIDQANVDKNGNTIISGVGAGKADTDAVNVGQLKDVVAGANKGFNISAQGKNESNVGNGGSVDFNNTDGNIKVEKTANSNDISFNLNPNLDLGEEGSVTTGNTTVNNNGVSIKDGPSMTVDGIYAGNKTITGVADGIEVNDAVNLGQLNALDQRVSNSVNELGYKIGEVEDGANAGISAAMAMSSLPQAYIPGKSMIGGGVATYNGQSAVAVGISRVSDNGRWVIKANGTADTQGNAGGAIGAGFHF